MKTIFGLLAIIALACSNLSCNHGPVPVIGQAVIDCTTADRAKIDEMLAEFKPLLTSGQMDWSALYARAKSAGSTIGGCVLAELTQYYLGNRLAPSNSDGWQMRGLLEDFRANEANGATFKTADGDL